MWLDPPIALESWNSVSSLFCMFISHFLHSLFAFPNLFSRKKKISLLSLSSMNFVIYIPLMKLSNVLFRKSLHLSLYSLSYEYVCADCLMFPCICSVL